MLGGALTALGQIKSFWKPSCFSVFRCQQVATALCSPGSSQRPAAPRGPWQRTAALLLPNPAAPVLLVPFLCGSCIPSCHEAVLKARSSKRFTQLRTSPLQRREQQGGWWPVPGSLSWDSELSCCVSGAKCGSVSSVYLGYHVKNSGTVRVNQQRVECIMEGDNNCAGRWV